MPSYDLTKRADRESALADYKATVEAVNNGSWPRDVNDAMRWNVSNARWWAVDCPRPLTPATYAKYMCQAEIEYLEDVQTRIEAGELPAEWEA